MLQPAKKIVGVILARKTGVLDPASIEAIDRHVRVLLAPFKLGRRLKRDLTLNEGVVSMSFKLECSGQTGLNYAAPGSSDPELEFEREALAVVDFLKDSLQSLHDHATGILSTPYDIDAAVERMHARGILKGLSSQDAEASGRAVYVNFADSSAAEFRLSALPGRVLAQESTNVAFQVAGVGLSIAQIKCVRGPQDSAKAAARRAEVHWDPRSHQTASKMFFDLMHQRLTLSLPLRAVLKPNGVIDRYHFPAEAAERLLEVYSAFTPRSPS